MTRTFKPAYHRKADFDALTGGGIAVYNSIGTVGSPGDLRNNTGSANTLVYTTGFTTPDDGGGGFFRWVVGPATDDGGTIIVPGGSPGGYWSRQFEGSVYSIKWFGAASSVGDNGPIINSMITSLGTDKATIYVPQDPGTTSTVYTIGTNVTFPTNIIMAVETPGAQLSISSTFTLTINSRVDAGPDQIFAGAGDVVFAEGEGWTNWWSVINTALNSGLKKLNTADGTYAETTTINIPSDVSWEGNHSSYNTGEGVIIQPTSAVSEGIKTYAGHYYKVKNITMVMDNMSDAVTVGPATTISFTSSASGGTISDSGSGLGSFTEGQVLGVSGSTGSLNDSTYHIVAATASSLTVKGVSLTTQSAGASVTLRAGAVGIRLQGSRRSIWENVKSILNTGRHGAACWQITPRDGSGFASYYNKFLGCDAKTDGSVKQGIGFGAAAYGAGTVTMNNFDTCRVQACGIDWLLAGTGSGFQLDTCNGESAGQWGIYVSDVPSAVSTAVKVKNGEWHSCDAGEVDALLMKDATINGTAGDNVTRINFGQLFNNFYRADQFVGEERLSNYGAAATITPSSTFMRISGTSGPVTLNTTTPISAGSRGQILCLVGDDTVNIVTMKNSGNVILTQPRWYGFNNTMLLLQYSQTSSAWIEIARTDTTPQTIRSAENSFFRQRVSETTLTLSGASTPWTNAIPAGVEVIGVTCGIKTVITGATGFEVGTSGDPNLWADKTATAAGTKTDMADFTDTSRQIFTTGPTSIIVTAKGSPFTGGEAILTLHYQDLGAADV